MMRRLICSNQLSVINYNTKAWELLQFHRIKAKLDALEAFFHTIDRDLWCIRLNMIDKQVTDTLLHTKKHCRKLRIGEVEYSPEVSKVAEK